MVEVLKPFEVRTGDTTSVGEHVRDNDYSFFVKDFFGHEGSRTVSSLEDNFAIEKSGIVFMDRLLLGSWDENVTLLLHERLRIDNFNFFGMAVVGKGAVSEHLGSDIVDVEALRIVDCRVVFDNTHNDSAILLQEFGSPISNCAETLDNESLALYTLDREVG